MRLLITIMLLATAGLTACAVGPSYEPPVVVAPEQFIAQEMLAVLSRTPSEDKLTLEKAGNDEQPVPEEAMMNWWRGFNDPLLTQLVEQALEQNYTIIASMAQVKEAGAFVNFVDAGDALTAVLDGELAAEEQRVLNKNNSKERNFGFSQFGALAFLWPLDIFGRNAHREKAARAELSSATAALRTVILAVSAAVTSEYLQMRGNQRQLELLKQSVELQEKTRAIVKIRYEAGLSPELDLKRAEASVASLRADIPALEEALINSRTRLALLTGQFPGKLALPLLQGNGIPEYTGTIPLLVPAEVLSLRPDVEQAEAQLKSAIAEIGVAKAQYFPVFQLAGQISIGSTGISGQPNVDILISSISALINQVLLDGGARQANLTIAKAQAEQALANYRQTLVLAITEVENTLAALQASQQRQDALETAVQASTRSSFQAEILYKQGLTSFLDVVDAQRVLASAQQQLAAARTNYATQIARLFQVLGTTIRADTTET